MTNTRHDKGSGDVVHTGVIGSPVRHSLSPAIHNYWIKKYNLSGRYDLLPVEPDDFAVSFHALQEKGYSGFNITLPFKQTVMGLCDRIEPAAAAIGAVNTIYTDESGRLVGTNTDAYGFWENLKEQIQGLDIAGKKALVLGAGGAARAVVYAVKEAGAEDIFVANRTYENAESLTRSLGGTPVRWNNKLDAASSCALVVNTTPLGMTGKPPLDFDVSILPDEAIVYDIVYRPLLTDLVKQAKVRDLPTVTGLGMLVHQAVPGFQAWYGVRPTVTAELIDRVSQKARTGLVTRNKKVDHA